MEEREATSGQRLTATLRQQGNAGIITIASVSRKSQQLHSVITASCCKGRGQSTTLRAVAERRTLQPDIPEEHSPSNCMGMCMCTWYVYVKMHCPLSAMAEDRQTWLKRNV